MTSGMVGSVLYAMLTVTFFHKVQPEALVPMSCTVPGEGEQRRAMALFISSAASARWFSAKLR